MFTFIDLFAGIGGFRLAFESIGGKCVFTSEINKFCQKTYLANHKVEYPLAGDITKIKECEIPDHDVLLAGFPCQPFSIAGVSSRNALGRTHGFECSTQGTLFFDIERIIKEKSPRIFVLENVKNLLSHNKGETFKTIKHVLEDKLGYNIFYKIVDAKLWVPQHRERIIIVGFKDFIPFKFNVPNDMGSQTLDSILHKHNETEIPYVINGVVNNKYTLSDNLWSCIKRHAEKHKQKGNGFSYGLVNDKSIARTLSARYYKDGSEILLEQEGNPRRLTPRECARLMGFPDSFDIVVSDAQAYRQFGNSVVVPVFKYIAEQVKPYI